MSPWDLTVCIFAKVPERGQVKTRLARTEGDERATQLATAFWRDTNLLAGRAALELPNTRVVNVLAGDLSLATKNEALGEVWLQGEGSLGDRLERNLHRALTDSKAVIALGTDSPGLPFDLLLEAAVRLRADDAVIGPAADGGYYLLGLRTCPDGLLDGVQWSTSETRRQTCERLTACGLGWLLLGEWFDVDTQSDLDRLRGLLRNGDAVAPHTRLVLGMDDAR